MIQIKRTNGGDNVIVYAETFEHEAYEQVKKLANYEAYRESKIRIMPDEVSPPKLFSSKAYIELPDKYLLRLEYLGLIKPIKFSEIIRHSVYFYDRHEWFTPEVINTLASQYELDQKVRDEYVKFHNMPQEYKTEAIENFLREIKGYINRILQNYYDDLAKCC